MKRRRLAEVQRWGVCIGPMASGAFDLTVWGEFRAMRGRGRGRQECANTGYLSLPIATASGTRPCSDWHGTGTGSEAETQTPRDRRICGIRRCRRVPSSERRSRTEPVRRRQARRAALPSAHQRERGNQRSRNRIPPKDAHSSGYIPLSAAGVRAFAWRGGGSNPPAQFGDFAMTGAEAHIPRAFADADIGDRLEWVS